MGEKQKPWRPARHHRSERRAYVTSAHEERRSQEVNIERVGHPSIPEFDARRQCTRKRVFGSADIAAKVALDRSERWGSEVRAYPCPHCGGYHIGRIGSQPE